MLIQFILIIIIALLILRLLAQLKKKRISWSQFLFWLIIWVLAIIAIWQPKLTVLLANYVGVGRGVDLVVYVAVIVVFFLLFRLLMRVEKMEKDITKVVRQAALEDKGKEKF